MKRYEMIKNQDYFSSIIKSGKYNKDKLFVIYYIYNERKNYSHFGIAIKKSIGKAFVRNRIKRQVRNIVDNNKNLFQKDKDYIIMIRNGCANASYQQMENSIQDLVKGIDI